MFPVFDSAAVERAADDMIPDAGKVLDAPSADEHHGVLLQVMADARDVGRNYT